MRQRFFVALNLLLALWLGADLIAPQQATKATVAGITNLARLETTVACSGAIKAAEAVPEIKKMGCVSMINLREATEPGAEVEKEGEMARAAGRRYFHIPFNGAMPDPK